MKTRGFTLIELLAVVAIAGIVCLAGIPGISTMIEKQRVRNASTSLFHGLSLAREHAILRGDFVSMCPSEDGRQCGKGSSRFLIVFSDQHGDGALENSSRIIHVIDFGSSWGVEWRAFGRKPQLTLTPQGYTKHQNGSFYLCPTDGQERSRIIIVNKAGRGRMAPDKNGNGFAENTKGQDVYC